MNEIAATINNQNRTPIELALKIDDEGYTTAKALYSWLELDPSNYSRWVKQNITENPYADENDFFAIGANENGFSSSTTKTPIDAAFEESIGGRPSQDYRISANLAKKICMTTHSDRGDEARSYFLGCEIGLKRSIEIIKDLQIQVNSLQEITNQNASHIVQVSDRLTCLESGASVSGGKLSKWVQDASADIMELAKYCDCTVKEMYSNVIDRMEQIYGINFQRYFDEYAASHPNEKPIWRIVVIEYYDLKDAFEDAYVKIGRDVGLYHRPDDDEWYNF